MVNKLVERFTKKNCKRQMTQSLDSKSNKEKSREIIYKVRRLRYFV